MTATDYMSRQHVSWNEMQKMKQVKVKIHKNTKKNPLSMTILKRLAGTHPRYIAANLEENLADGFWRSQNFKMPLQSPLTYIVITRHVDYALTNKCPELNFFKNLVSTATPPSETVMCVPSTRNIFTKF